MQNALKFFIFFFLNLHDMQKFHLKQISGGRELENNVLAGELLVDRAEGVQLVFQRSGILGIQETIIHPISVRLSFMHSTFSKTYARMVLEPSVLTRVRLPTISEGYTRSSKMAPWTAVKVRDLGRGCLALDLRPSLGRMRRWATKTTWRSENFFSSSRVNL